MDFNVWYDTQLDAHRIWSRVDQHNKQQQQWQQQQHGYVTHFIVVIFDSSKLSFLKNSVFCVHDLHRDHKDVFRKNLRWL